jgi:hypothetical protein
MRVTLKAVNAELTKRGRHAMLVNGDGYFYFRGGEATDWLDRTYAQSRRFSSSDPGTLLAIAQA